MRRFLLLLLVCLAPAFAATPNVSTLTWSVYQAGNSANGGCFDTATGATHTDYSDQSGAQVTFSLANANRLSATQNSTTVTSAGTPFTLAMQGNCINLVAVNNCIAGTYLVTVFGSSSSITVDRAPATAGNCTVGTGTLGGALALPTQATANAVAGNIVWVKKDGIYAPGAQTVMSATATAGSPIQVVGYNTVRGDNGKPVIQTSASLASGVFRISGAFWSVQNFQLDCNSKATTIGMQMAAADATAQNILIQNCTTVGVDVTSGGARNVLKHVTVTGTTSAGTASFRLIAASVLCFRCAALSGAADGFLASAAASPVICIKCIASSNSGASSNGYESTAVIGMWLIQSIADHNGKYGYMHNNASGVGGNVLLRNIFNQNTSGGIDSSNTAWTTGTGLFPLMIDWNAFNESTPRTNFPAGPNDVTLSGDPFTNEPGGVFTLNTIAGRGAAIRGITEAETYVGLATTDYQSIGATEQRPIINRSH